MNVKYACTHSIYLSSFSCLVISSASFICATSVSDICCPRQSISASYCHSLPSAIRIANSTFLCFGRYSLCNKKAKKAVRVLRGSEAQKNKNKAHIDVLQAGEATYIMSNANNKVPGTRQKSLISSAGRVLCFSWLNGFG